jgi:hypothetical protein
MTEHPNPSPPLLVGGGSLSRDHAPPTGFALEGVLAEALYLAFWQRNQWRDRTPFGQAPAPVQEMWAAIAADALMFVPELSSAKQVDRERSRDEQPND